MFNKPALHSFHIPVMGVAYTIDSPLRVAEYGISSVISLVDDLLMEKMRELYSKKFELPFSPISSSDIDARAKRITSYLNMVDSIVKAKIEELLNKKSKVDLRRFSDLLPNTSTIKLELNRVIENKTNSTKEFWNKLKESLTSGLIDVNIMTKVDKENYHNGEKLSDEYNDAHAALRGFAQSSLKSSIVLSAGMNPKLYGYIESFDDFYPNANFELKKKVILKVSDFRSALIQGKFLAKKGIWISEYRIESGLNCGGHAFASDGLLLGPILQEFADNREMLISSNFEMYIKALADKGKNVPSTPPELKISVQGGVGTHEEHQMLLDKYKVDSVGWGSPFLLVKEATCVDDGTRKRLADAREEDLYLSNISPLGVMFNNLRGSSKELERDMLIAKGKPGSYCPKRFLALNKEYSERGECTASISFIKKKVDELKAKNLPQEEFDKEYKKITEKSCLCIGLVTSAFIEHGIDGGKDYNGITICPGPNTAYFTKEVSLKEMVRHIYGTNNVIERTDRPHMFIKELTLYVSYLKDKVAESAAELSTKEAKFFNTFKENLLKGIEYYKSFFTEATAEGKQSLDRLFNIEKEVDRIC
ncbi:hypothetical protein [uncultured Acetobacteroides sp.]|uniref:hypothetical protein n=1 Tax=uncultured Acetobacteroides sp. TaxID=1760811 RepID=UPI0029F54775|nr:hypothetical protein [uncultured Acetobacteroides sp.]